MVRGMRSGFLLIVIFTAAVVLAQCDSSDDGSGGECSEKESGLIDVGGEADTDDCGELIKYFHIENVLATSDGKFYEILGETLIDFNNSFYLRGHGVRDEDCYNLIYGESPFTVRTRYTACTERVAIDVIREPDADAPSVCTIRVVPEEFDCGYADLK